MIVRGAAVKGDLNLQTKILIVGSGPGGSTAAMILAESGQEVLVLEEGPYVTAAQLNQKEQEMMGLLFQEGGTRMSEDKGITILHGKAVGGGSVVNHLICYRTPDRILELWGKEGIEDLDPVAMKRRFDRIWEILNIAPITPEQLNRNNALLREGAIKLGWEGHCFERNAVQCYGSGFCTLGCAYNAKQSAALTMIPLASKHGARVQADCRVTKILHDGTKAIGVEGVVLGPDKKPKGKLSVKAEIVILSGGAIRSPALLLHSGVPDPGKRIGENLHLHPATPVVGHFAGQDVNSYEGILQGYAIDQFSWSLRGDPLDALLEGVAGPPGVASVVVGGIGQQHADAMKMLREAAITGVLMRDHHPGKVVVDPEGKPKVHYSLHPEDAGRMRTASKRTMEAYFAAGADFCLTAHSVPFKISSKSDFSKVDAAGYGAGEVGLISYHQMGSLAMGSDPQKSATNPDGRLWGLSNLYVADSSLFPTASGVNPQISVYGMSMRVAERLAASLK